MTVKEIAGVLKDAQKIVLGYGSSAVQFDKDDPLMLDAYGNYVVADVCNEGEGYYEVNVAVRFVKAGEA